MKETVNFALGFVTGRANVCKIINNTYSQLIKQFDKSDKKIQLTMYILYDLNYQGAERAEFYEIRTEVYKEIKIKYITPEDIAEEKKKVIGERNFTKQEVETFFGYGHAKGRNTLMYFALKDEMDYLMFWDDDEYPVACIKEKNKEEIEWKEQDNIALHLKYIENADITIGYHCGYISPIPCVELNKEVDEEKFREYVESIGNELISWDSIKEKFVKDNGITYANKDIIEKQRAYEIQEINGGKWVAGSTLCINLHHIDKIPAFYNPEGARGEDTFFSTRLTSAKVIKIPVYHFHDGFLKYTSIVQGDYPKVLRKIKSSEEQIEQRFLQVSRGWIKYKPLYLYITEKEKYKEKIGETLKKLEEGIPEINKLFMGKKFNILLEDLKEYDKNVEINYEEYIETNRIWNELKMVGKEV